MRMRLEVQLATPLIGYVGIELRRREVGMAQHLLDRAEIRAALEQVRCKGVPQQVRMHAIRLEPGLLGESTKDQERACAGEPAAFRIRKSSGRWRLSRNGRPRAR